MTSGPIEQRRTILVVDDSEIVLDITRAALEDAGHVVVTRVRPEGTIGAILQEKPDLVLLDVNMPRMSGEMIASVLATAAPARETILLLHSSLPAELLKLKVLQTGAHGYIQKTGNLLELVNQVGAWLKKGAGLDRGTSTGRPVRGRVRFPASIPEIPPSQRLTSASAPPRAAMSGAIRLSLPTALFVDHDRVALSGYEADLRGEPIVAELTQSSEHALTRILSSNPPDVVVCEALLPNLSGTELFDRAIAHDATWRQRFVFATAGVSSEVSDFLASRDARVLHKPVHTERLVRAVRYAALAARVFRDGKANER
ncbi:MAG TPA: response regulator [Polyangiaceae bacterium]